MLGVAARPDKLVDTAVVAVAGSSSSGTETIGCKFLRPREASAAPLLLSYGKAKKKKTEDQQESRQRGGMVGSYGLGSGGRH